MTRPYDKSLRMKAFEIAAGLGYELKSGVYFAGTGPSYETPAEYKYFRLIGADAVGILQFLKSSWHAIQISRYSVCR